MSRVQALPALRDADWFDGPRARAYLIILTVVMAAVAIGYLIVSRHGLDPAGKPLGTDFASFWTASQLALGGHPADAWTLDIHKAAQDALFGPEAGYAAFFYPPPYLLLCLPLALVPYPLALAAWLVVTGTAWLRMARIWLREAGAADLGWLPLLGFPAVLINAGHGQNGFLTAALLGTGALICRRRPWLAGALFGALVVKPHLAVLVPLFLIFAGNWRSFLAAGLTALGLCLISLAAFGPLAWQNFFDGSELARAALQDNLVGYAKMQSSFAAARLLGASGGPAWTAQLVAGAVGVWAMWRVRRHATSLGTDMAANLANGAVLVSATLLATPFLLDYDLTVLAVPLIWLFARARRDGFLPWERLLLVMGFLLPLVARPMATLAHIPLTPLVMLAVTLCIVRRAGFEWNVVAGSSPAPARP